VLADLLAAESGIGYRVSTAETVLGVANLRTKRGETEPQRQLVDFFTEVESGARSLIQRSQHQVARIRLLFPGNDRPWA
jgi:hypothetical protein